MNKLMYESHKAKPENTAKSLIKDPHPLFEEHLFWNLSLQISRSMNPLLYLHSSVYVHICKHV